MRAQVQDKDTVTVKKDGRTETKAVTVDKARRLEIGI